MDPRRLLGKLLKEHSRIDRPAVAPAGVLDIRDARLDDVAVLIIERQAPKALAGSLEPLGESLIAVVVVCKDAAVDQAQRDGLRALGQFIYYDAIVMHGPGEDPDSFGGIRSAAMKSAKTPAQSGDETAYLNAFLDARKAAMQMEEGHADTTRVDTMQRAFLRAGNLDLNPPLSFKVYRDSYKISDASQT